MCGIAGIISSTRDRSNIETIKKMIDAMAHRGPDGEATWMNPSHHTLFGHRRLSIIDLSENAAQPMHYLDRYTIVYNGEIYNYIELKQYLKQKGYLFRTQSDTEVILAAYDCFNSDCLQHFDGMFAFAIWDEKEKSLFAARDRFGEKPFYYLYDSSKNVFWFASEIKGLLAAAIQPVDNQMLLLYLTLGYTSNPSDPSRTFYSNIYQLPPRSFLKFRAGDNSLKLYSYWDLDKENTLEISEEQAIEKFRDLLQTSVERRLRSDVSIGTSLSGGLDSSSIAATIQKHKSTNVTAHAFSAIFPGYEKNEQMFIEKVAFNFQLITHFTTPTADGFIKDFEKLMYVHDEPISSSSVYAQYKVFELAKDHEIKVLIDGQGADETIAGYRKYIHWYLQELLGKRKFIRARKEKKAFSKNGIYFYWGLKNYVATWFPLQTAFQLEKREAKKVKTNSFVDRDFARNYFNRESIQKPVVLKLNDILYFNTSNYGLDELLRYADRNSMSHGREVRLPFLSHELVQFLFSLPSHYKIHKGWTKWILRKSFENDLPHEIVWHKRKVGFEPPQRQWMENQTVQDYISESKRKLVAAKVLKPSVLNKKIQPQHAYAADNFDWRYLVAGAMLK